MGILTLEDFNTLLGLYGGITTEYIIDSNIFDGVGQYDFLDVTVSSSNYVVEVVNSLFTGAYTVLSGASVSYSNGKFTFPTAQTTRIKILMGANTSSKLEFTKFVTRPCHQDYVCSMIAKDASGNILSNKSVSIGSYTGTTNSNGEVSITIPANRADIYQYPISVDNVEMDTLELLRTKVSLNPVCTTNSLYVDSAGTLTFNLGNIGHSVDCKCIVDGYTYTASSNSSGVVSFTINLNGYNDDSVEYVLKVLADDWVNETNITGTVICEYYTVTSYAELKTAYNSGIDTVKIEGTITIDSKLYVNRDFYLVGGEDNLLTGNSYFIMNSSNKTLKLEGINSNGLNHLVDVNNNNLLLESCSFESSSDNFVTVSGGTISSKNSRYENMKSCIFLLYGGTLNIDNSEFIITDLEQTDVRLPLVAHAYGARGQHPQVTMNVNHSSFDIDIADTSTDLGIIPSLFNLNLNTIFNNVPYENLRANNTLPMDTNVGDIDFTASNKHYSSSVPGKSFIWSITQSYLYYENVVITEES